jgi:hypothetical protein
MAINRDISTSLLGRLKSLENHRSALLLRPVRSRRWRLCAKRLGNKDGDPAEP